MKILVLFECSGEVSGAFAQRGHIVKSCDKQDTEGTTPHYKGDVYDILFKEKQDIIILHPPCPKLCVSGNHVYAKGKPRHHERINSLKWTEKLFWDCVKMARIGVCLENPVGVLSTMSNLPKPHYIQPYQFGEDASKKTGLWLWNLPKLKPAKRYPGRKVTYNGKVYERWSNQTDSGQNKLSPGPNRSKERSRTYTGIANAMAQQWG